nr:DNA polymerase [Bacteroidales bacterium]
MNEKKLFLLDAYALIYRAYYAFIRMPRYTTKGDNVSAIFGFVNTLYEVLQKEKPSHIGVCFDPKGGTFRNEMYAPYKANREKTPEDISFAIPYIKDIIKGFNIRVIEVANYEADDVIGTLAKKGARAGFDVYMMTPDKDYGQLVEENIKMYKPAKGGNDAEVMGVDEICAKHGIENPLQVIDILALWGDASDNIPGCPGVGEKTATKLIGLYGSVEGLYEHTDELKGKQKEKVENSKEQVMLSKELATIKLDVPVEFDAKALEIQPLNDDVLRGIFEKLEFRNFVSRILGGSTSGAPAKKAAGVQGSLFGDESDEDEEGELVMLPSKKAGIADTVHRYHLLDTDEKIKAFVDQAIEEKEICFDTETTGLDPHKAELVGASFSYKAHEAYYVPFAADFDEIKARLQLLVPILGNAEQLKIGQNLKYDISVLLKYDIEVLGPLFDTMLAHYLIRPNLRHNLDYLSEIYLNYTKVSTEELIGKKGKNQLTMRDIPVETVAEYACEDADITYQLKEPLEKEEKQNGLDELLYKMELPLLKVLSKMEHNGVTIDEFAIGAYADELALKIADLEKEIISLAGKEFNVASPSQVGEILFDHLGIEAKGSKTKTGKYSSSEEVLSKIKTKHPIIALILKHRKLKKLLTTYVLALPEMIN